MPKYNVIITVDASICVEVEAENEQRAKELALEQADNPCLCNQCADDLFIGDLMEATEATVKE